MCVDTEKSARWERKDKFKNGWCNTQDGKNMQLGYAK